MPGTRRGAQDEHPPTPTAEELTASPHDRVAAACAAYGERVIALWCADLLAGRVAYDDPGTPPLSWVGGRHGAALLADPTMVSERGHGYWVRVWGARGLLYAWAPEAAPAVVGGLTDPAWRVREMAAKVARQREIGEAGDALAGLVDDETPRVRAAAIRALGAVGEGEHADPLHEAADDPEPAVRRAAELALDQLRRRLDRDV